MDWCAKSANCSKGLQQCSKTTLWNFHMRCPLSELNSLENSLVGVDNNHRYEFKSRFAEVYLHNEMIWKQQSKKLWIKEGNKNTWYIILWQLHDGRIIILIVSSISCLNVYRELRYVIMWSIFIHNCLLMSYMRWSFTLPHSILQHFRRNSVVLSWVQLLN